MSGILRVLTFVLCAGGAAESGRFQIDAIFQALLILAAVLVFLLIIADWVNELGAER